MCDEVFLLETSVRQHLYQKHNMKYSECGELGKAIFKFCGQKQHGETQKGENYFFTVSFTLLNIKVRLLLNPRSQHGNIYNGKESVSEY